MDKLKPTNREKANVEAEKGETVVTKFFQDLFPEHYEIDGKKHKDGGTPLSLPEGSFIFSDASEMKIKDKNVLSYLGEKKAKTIAEIAKKYDLNKFKKILTDKNVSPIDRNSALVGMSNNLEKLGFLALYQEMMKGLPDGVPEISQEFLKKNPEYVDKINEILSKEKNTGTDGQQVPQAFMGMSFTANDFNDGPGNRKRKKSDDYVSEKLEPKPLDFSSLFKTNQSEQEEREISTNPSNTTPNNQQNNIDNQTPVRKYLGPPYHLESFLASKKQEILKDPIRGSYNPEISVKEKPTPDFPPNEYSPDGPWADPLSDTFRNTPAEKLETRSVFDQKTDQETQELKKSGLDKEFEENYKKIKEKSDEIDDKYYEKNIKKMTKEELKKLREDLESGKLKATVKNYNMSLVFPGGYRSMLMDKAMANWASWLEGSLQAAYASPVYNANRVYGSQPALSKGDYVQSGTSTGEYRPDRMTRIGGYSSFVYPYYPQSHPQMNEGGQVNKFDPGMAIKEIYERLGYNHTYESGGSVEGLDQDNLGFNKEEKLTNIIKRYLDNRYGYRAELYKYKIQDILDNIQTNMKYDGKNYTYNSHPLIMDIEDYIASQDPEFGKKVNKARNIFVKNMFNNNMDRYGDYLYKRRRSQQEYEQQIDNQYNDYFKTVYLKKEYPFYHEAPRDPFNPFSDNEKIYYDLAIRNAIKDYAKAKGKSKKWELMADIGVDQYLRGNPHYYIDIGKSDVKEVLNYLKEKNLIPDEIIKKAEKKHNKYVKDEKIEKEENIDEAKTYAEGGPVGDSENKNNEQQKNIDLTGLIKDYLAKKYKHKAHVYGYDQRAIESAILKNLKYGTPGTTYSTHPLIMEIEDYMGQKYPEYQKALNKSRALFVKNEFGNDFSKFRDYLVEQKLMTTAHERDISNQYNQFYRDILNNKETPNEKNEDKNQTTSRAPENKKDTTDPQSNVFFGVLDIGIGNYAKQHGKDSSWISQRREDISNLLKGKSTSSSSKKELTPLLQYLENEDILPSDVIKKMTNDIENTQKDNKDKKEPISPKYNKDKKETTPEKNTSEPKENLNWSVFNEAIENAYNNLKAQLPDLVNSIYDKVYKDKKHTEQEKEIAKKNIEKLVLSSFDATKKGLYDSDGVSFSKQSKTSTAQTSKLNNQLRDLIAKGDKDALKQYVETAMKINAVNNISNTNPQIFTNPEIRKSLESGNALMNKDAAAKLRKEYFDAWGLPNYGDPAKVKDDLGVALFQYSFNRNKDIDDDNLVLTSKDYQDGSNVYYKRPKEFRQGLKSKDSISAIDGYYGDRTQNQFMLDLGVFAEPKKEEPKKAEEVKTEQKEIKPEVKAEQLQTIAPKLKARGYYFLQDKNRIAQALHNLYSIRKRPPYEPEPMVSLPDYSLLDPSRALQASQQAYKMGMEQVGSYLPPQVAAAQVSMMSGQAATDAANIISDTQNKNVAIANQASLTTANLINNYLQRKENQMRSLHDKYTIMEERYTADRNKALANLTDAINNAITNAAKNQTINEILYKDSPYYVEPETGGTTHFDPRYAKDITMTAKKDRTTMMNELMGNLRKHNIDTSKMTPDDAEKWLRLYGISDVSGSETIEPGVKKEEKETFTPWWRLFPFNKNE